MKNLLKISAVAVLLSSCTADRLAREATFHYDHAEYYTAAQKYSEYLQMKEDNQSRIRLAYCYAMMHRYSEAEKQFSKVVNLPETKSLDFLSYARILKRNGKYSEASRWYVEYLLDNPAHLEARMEMLSCDSITEYNKLSYEYDVKLVPFNAGGSDFSPVYYKEGIVFASDRTNPLKASPVSTRTGRSYLDLYYVETAAACIKPDVVPFSSELNSDYHESSCCFSGDGNTIYFTRSLVDKNNKPEKSKANINHFRIFTSHKMNGAWSTPVQLDLGVKEASAGHPALSKDGNRLFFASDAGGGFGGTDIYYSDYDMTTGTWRPAVNAGSVVNTKGDEMFPTLYTDATGIEHLYFSSDGREGMGGMDMYYCTVKNPNLICSVNEHAHGVGAFVHETDREASSFTRAIHLYAPLNSAGDDFGIVFAADGNSGYLSSDRDNESGIDKIYSFTKYIPQFYIEVKVMKKGTNEVVPGAQLELFDYNNNKSNFTAANEDGVMFLKIDRNSSLGITARKSGFFTASMEANNIGKVFTDTIFMTMELEGIEINKPMVLDNIYYDYDKWDLRTESLTELDKLVKILTDNPDIQIELSSHTDSRGSDKYNMTLSQKRAQSAVDYIIGKGIDAKRIYAKGYGESRLRNGCGNKVKCTEDAHQLNRRTEFTVVKIMRQF